MYGETTVHIENSNVEVNDKYMMHIDRQAIYDSVSTPYISLDITTQALLLLSQLIAIRVWIL